MIKVREDPHPDVRLDAYLDGLLTGDERAQVEQRIAEDPALRRTVNRQRAIDASVGRVFAPPDPATTQAIVAAARRAGAADAADAPRGPGTARSERGWMVRRWSRPLALAASLLLFVGGVWLTWSSLVTPRGGSGYEMGPFRSVERVRADALAGGFVPDVVCRDDEEFERWFRDQFRRGLRLAPLPEGVTTLGLGYSNTISPATIYLLARADSEPIVVFVDRGNLGRIPSVSPESGLHLHRGHVGDLILYELSPLDTPRLLPHFRDPDAEPRDANGRGATGS